jgi:hypothetical protein
VCVSVDVLSKDSGRRSNRSTVMMSVSRWTKKKKEKTEKTDDKADGARTVNQGDRKVGMARDEWEERQKGRGRSVVECRAECRRASREQVKLSYGAIMLYLTERQALDSSESSAMRHLIDSYGAKSDAFVYI